MTAPTEREALDQAVEDVLARRRGGLAVDEVEALGMALRVPCPPEPRGCGKPAGVECVNLSRGGPLTRQLFHLARGKAGGVQWTPTTEAERLTPSARISKDAHAARHWTNTGTDLPGYHRGKPWSPDGSHLEQRGGGARW